MAMARSGIAIRTLLITALVLAPAGCGESRSSVGDTESALVRATATPGATATATLSTTSPAATPTGTAEAPRTSTGPDPTGPDEPVLPVTVVDETGARITIKSVERIIPLDGDVAEIVFALGLGENVVATDLSATHPPEADDLPEIGYQRALSAETVASFAPTVLLATDVTGPPEALDGMRRLGYPLVILPNEATPTGAGQKIRAVAAALGIAERGEEMADELDAAIAEATVPSGQEGHHPRVVALYVRGTATQLVLGRSTNPHWLIEAAGGVDVSEEMGVDDTAPISAEAILAAAPDVLLVPHAGLESVGGVNGLLEIGGLGRTPAGRNRQVLVYDDQLLLGNGPRTAEMLTRLRDDLRAVIVATPPDPEEVP